MTEHHDQCRKCKARIIWTVTDKKRRMPVDPQGTSGEPNVWVWVENGITRSSANRPADPLMHTTSHFATCPDADRFRGRRVR